MLAIAVSSHCRAEVTERSIDVPAAAAPLLRMAYDDPDAAMQAGARLLKSTDLAQESRLHVLMSMGRAAQWLSRDLVLEVSTQLDQEPGELAKALAQVFRAQTLVETARQSDGLAILREAIPRLSAAGPYWAATADMEVCDAMVTAAHSNQWQESCSRARSAWRMAGRLLELARTDNLISLGHWSQGDVPAAIDSALAARAGFEQARSEGGVAMIDANLAELHLLSSHPQQALAVAEKSLAYETTVGKRVHALSTQNVRALALISLGRPEEAITVLDSAIAEARTLDAARILEDLLSTRLEASSRSRRPQEVAADAKILVAAIRSRYSKLVEEESAKLTNVYQMDLKDREVRRLEMTQRIQALETTAARADLELAKLRGDRWKLAGLMVSLVVGFVLLQVISMRRQNRALTVENRRRMELVGQAFHELRNPLVSISGLLDLALQGMGNHPSKSLIASARSAAAAVAESAQHQLDGVQVARDAVTLQVDAFDPGELIRQVCELISPEAWRKRLLLVQDVRERVPARLVGDENRIRQVLWNIASNAVKFTAHGSVRFDLDYTDDGLLLICVTDTGPGIAAADLKRIFQPFQRASAPDARTYGVGLGLSVADKLVRCMGGRIVPTALAEGGMRFEVELPLKTADPMPAESPAAATAQARAANTVLIVEDDPFMGELLIAQVEQLGARAVHVQTADDALKAVVDVQPCLVLVDYHLGDESGTELIGRLRATSVAPVPRMVIVSASQGVGPAQLEGARAPDSWIRKPVTLGALNAQLQRAIAAPGQSAA